jgi:transcriptional regulator with XRE-family HTH domain
LSSTKYLIFLGRAIRAVREQRGLSAHDLAAAAGVAPARVAALEDGQLDPDFELLIRLAEGMGLHPAAFFLRAEQLGDLDGEAGPEES